jgi:hypothetical protein
MSWLTLLSVPRKNQCFSFDNYTYADEPAKPLCQDETFARDHEVLKDRIARQTATTPDCREAQSGQEA